MEWTTPLIFYRNDKPGSMVECGRRDLTRAQGITFHQERKKNPEAFDHQLLDGFNQGRDTDQHAHAFSFGGLNVHIIKT